jgi:hypothetical protein
MKQRYEYLGYAILGLIVWTVLGAFKSWWALAPAAITFYFGFKYLKILWNAR